MSLKTHKQMQKHLPVHVLSLRNYKHFINELNPHTSSKKQHNSSINATYWIWSFNVEKLNSSTNQSKVALAHEFTT